MTQKTSFQLTIIALAMEIVTTYRDLERYTRRACNLYSGYTVEDGVESKQGGENFHILSPLLISAWKASREMMVPRDNGGGLCDCK